jgi:type I site-specific restriction-modification system R (restriction) subunit
VAINTGLPNAPKIAFTGTPLIKSRKTYNEFGPYIDTYTIEQAVEDGATVQILYEGREAQTKVTGDSLDRLFDEYFQDKSVEEKAAIRRKYGTEHTLLQAIARVNRTYTGKSRGFIVDYYGLSDYLTEALEMFSSEDVEGALKDLKDEIPRLKATHTRVMGHFKGLDKTDMDACVLSLEDEDRRQQFEIDFKKFAKQLDIIMPDPAARPYLADLKFLGKVNHGARNRYRDSQLDLAGVGEKVRRLIDEHIRATGVDPKIPPLDLLATDFKQRLQEHKSDRANASEIEHAIKHHIEVNLEQDEIRRVKQRIKRKILETSFDDPDLRKVVMDRFMELAQVKYKP